MTLRLELFVTDVDASLAFYRDVLGFEVLGGQDTYRALRSGQTRIAVQDVRTLDPVHPLAQPGPRGLGVEIVHEVQDVTALHKQVRARWARVTALREQAWGLADFRVTDPDGYYWRITAPRS